MEHIIHLDIVFFIQNSECSWRAESLLRMVCCDESTSQELLSDLLSDLRKLVSAMEFFQMKQLEAEDEEDTHLRNNTLTPLLGFVCPIFKPDPNVYPVFQVIIIIFAICIQVITVAASSRTVTQHEFYAIFDDY